MWATPNAVELGQDSWSQPEVAGPREVDPVGRADRHTVDHGLIVAFGIDDSVEVEDTHRPRVRRGHLSEDEVELLHPPRRCPRATERR